MVVILFIVKYDEMGVVGVGEVNVVIIVFDRIGEYRFIRLNMYKNVVF